MTSYDDAEGMLQDQGLEVVVIPYRPSPPPKPPLPPKRRHYKSNENLDLQALGSPASSDESKSCDDEPPLFTPRSQMAMAEATGQPSEISPPPTAASEPLTEKWRAKKAAASGRSQSAGRSTTYSRSQSEYVNTNNSGAKKKMSPPRIRSKSTPVSSKKSQRNLGFYQMAKLGYQELCNAIIRPPRSQYPLEALGPEAFVFCGERFVRKDFGVVNERGLLVECSMWKRACDDEEEEKEEEEEQVEYDESGEKETGYLTLNVDDWDENKESGQMYLHIPESFGDESLSSSSENGEDSEEGKEAMRENMRRYYSERTTHTYYHGRVKTRKRRRDPVVIYLHGNSSARTEVIPQLGHLLSLGVSVVAFDFAGSGKSEGEFVSLGYYEREDLQTVIHHLRASGDVSTIALWGRSMGAATAIMYGSRDPTISCMVLDSSFTDLTRLAEEMVEKGKEQGVNVPNFVVSVALRMIKNSVKSQAGFSIRHISPISHVNRCFIPAMFVAGEHDDFINKRHSELLHQRYAGDKNLVLVDGDHNSPRPRFLMQSSCLFLQSCMQLPPSLELVVPVGTNLCVPPWSCPMSALLGLGKTNDGYDGYLERRTTNANGDSTDGRSWLPITDSEHPQNEEKRPASAVSFDDKALMQGDNPPPALPSNQGYVRSRSCTEPCISPPGADYYSALPDMSERQKAVQDSLFKMLGQHENKA